MANPREWDDDLEDDESEWGLGVYTAVAPVEPDGERLTRLAESKRWAQRTWDAIQRNLRDR